MAVLSAPELFAYVPAFCVAGYVLMAAGIAGFLYVGLRSRFQVDTQRIKTQSRKLKFSIVALTCLMMCTSFLMTAPIVSANTVATTGYYLATPLPIADWYLGNYSTGNIFAINGSSWANLMTYPAAAPWASVTGNYTAVWENVLAATSYGTIYAKEVAFPLSLHTTIPNNTQVICNYQGVTYTFTNSTNSMGSPYTVETGAVKYDTTMYTAKDSGNRILWSSTNQTGLQDTVLSAVTSGEIRLNEVAFDLALINSIPANVQVVCSYGDEHYTYINSADSLGSPYTVSVGVGVNSGYYLAADSGSRICFTSTNQSATIQNTINALTVGRTEKEKIVLSGNLGDVSNIILASNLILEGQNCKMNLPLTSNGILKATSDISNIEVTGITFTCTYGVRTAVDSVANAIIAFDGAVTYKTITNGLFQKCNFTGFECDDSVGGRGICAIMNNVKIKDCTFVSSNATAYGATQIYIRDGSNDVLIDGCSFTLNSLGNPIYGQQSNNIRVVNCFSTETSGQTTQRSDGFEFRGCSNLVIANNEFYQCGGNQIYLCGDATNGGNRLVTVDNNIFNTVGYKAVTGAKAITVQSPTSYQNMYIKITNNQIYNSFCGISIGGTDVAFNNYVEVKGNHFIDNTHDLHIDTNQIVSVNDNWFSAFYNVTDGYYIKFDNPYLQMANNRGVNPYGGGTPSTVLSYPIGVGAAHIIGWVEQGTSANLQASVDYSIIGSDMYITSSGGTNVSITIKDKNSNTVASGLTALNMQVLPVGWVINFGAYSVAPTVSVYFAGGNTAS
jgi:hypothetical protein